MFCIQSKGSIHMRVGFYPRAILVTLFYFVFTTGAYSSEIQLSGTIGYDFSGESTRLNEKQEFIDGMQAPFDVPRPHENCFNGDGITSVSGLAVSNAEEAINYIKVKGFLNGKVELICSDVSVTVPVYPAQSEGATVRIYDKVSDDIGGQFLFFRQKYAKHIYDTKKEFERYGRCVIFNNSSGYQSEAFCVVKGQFFTAHIFSGDGAESYHEARRDKFLKILKSNNVIANAGKLRGHPTIIKRLGNVKAESFFTDVKIYDEVMRKFHLALYELELADLNSSIEVADGFLKDLRE